MAAWESFSINGMNLQVKNNGRRIEVRLPGQSRTLLLDKLNKDDSVEVAAVLNFTEIADHFGVAGKVVPEAFLPR